MMQYKPQASVLAAEGNSPAMVIMVPSAQSVWCPVHSWRDAQRTVGVMPSAQSV